MNGRIQGARTSAAKPRLLASALLATTGLTVLAVPVEAQQTTPAAAPTQAAAPAPASAAAPAPVAPPAAPQVIRSLSVTGAQRLEPETILSYIKLRVGDAYTEQAADQALKDLYATELFTDVSVRNNDGAVVVQVKENPVINRIIFEGNKRLKEDKITKEIKLSPRQIFTRSKVRADVARIIELYKRQGRFAASVEPKMVMLDQNRVDIVFEVSEGPKSKVRKINIIGNEAFGANELKSQMMTKEAAFRRIMSSGTTYDPDRLAFDQQKLRQFYLQQGYADFRVVSAVAELTPDKRDFIITYVIEEGPRYHFGEVKAVSELRSFDSDAMTKNLSIKQGQWYDAKRVEDTVEQLTDLAGTFGYAFADVRPDFHRNKDDLTMDVTFRLSEAQRVYVERIDVNGNTLTQDKVVRREFRLAEGDAFNTLQVKRSTNRINSLGFFQDKFEVEQHEGSAPDRIVLEANVQEKATGELQLSAGFSSLEKFILQGSIQQRNFRGRGQTVGLSADWSMYSKSAQVSFVEPYVFDRNMSFGLDVYRRDLNSFNYLNDDRNTTYAQATTGFQARLGVPLSEYTSILGRYTLNYDHVTLDRGTYYTLDPDGNLTCNSLLAGRYLCDAVGNRLTSSVGLSFAFDNRDNRIRPTRGVLAQISGEFAGLGGDARYLRVTGNAAKYYPLGKGFVFSVSGEGGYIHSLESAKPGDDPVRLTDRFFVGEPQIRGFDIRGIGPRMIRKPLIDPDGNGVGDPNPDRSTWTDDALGGRAYYLAHAELEIPLGSGAREMGLRPSVFVDVGSVFGLRKPAPENSPFPGGTFIASRDANGVPQYSVTCNGTSSTVSSATGAPKPGANCGGAGDGVTALGSTIPPFQEFYYGNSPLPRVSVGFGVNWNSPFGPFRIDVAKALVKQKGDDTKLITFNVGTQF